MAKGGEGGYGAGDNVHKGTGSKGSTTAGYSMPKGKDEGPAVGGKDATFAVGGKTKMFGHQAAEPQKEGETQHDTGHDQSEGTGDKFAKGGSTKMFGYQGSVPARDGITSAR
jgi:hypothetical protein